MRRLLALGTALIGLSAALPAKVSYNRPINIITTNYDLVDTTYIDRGRIDGVHVGDKYTVKFPDGKLATQVVVTGVFDRMASVKIVDNWLLKDGQKADFKQRSMLAGFDSRERRPAPDIKVGKKAAASGAAPAVAAAPGAAPEVPAAPGLPGAPEAVPAAPDAVVAGVPAAPGLPAAPDAGLPAAPAAPGLPAGPDAGLPSAPDAGLPAAPDVSGLPAAPDAGLPPAPDAGLPPAPDAGLPPAPDAGLPPAPDVGGAPPEIPPAPGDPNDPNAPPAPPNF